MTVILIGKNERNEVELRGSLFYYKRMPAAKKARVIKANTKRGVTDWDAVADAAVQWGLLDWAEVFALDDDDVKHPVGFDRELIAELPDGDRAELGDLIIGGLGEVSKGKDPL